MKLHHKAKYIKLFTKELKLAFYLGTGKTKLLLNIFNETYTLIKCIHYILVREDGVLAEGVLLEFMQEHFYYPVTGQTESFINMYPLYLLEEIHCMEIHHEPNQL